MSNMPASLGDFESRVLVPANIDANAKAIVVGGVVYAYNDSGNIAPVRAWSAGDDGNSNSYAGLATYSRGIKFNGTTWDRERNNTEFTVLASAVRAATVSSADQINYNAKGVLLFLNVTVAPGVETLTIEVDQKDPVSGLYIGRQLFTAISTTGVKGLAIYPGIATGFDQQLNSVCPRTWRVTVTHSAGSNWTYSIGGAYLL